MKGLFHELGTIRRKRQDKKKDLFMKISKFV